jgi:nucleotide-binding universal stress UspA family protein
MSNKPYVVVVGAEFSAASELAVQKAFELAAQHPVSEVHLVNVVQTYGPQVAYEMPVDSSALQVLTVAEARARFQRYADEAFGRFLDRWQGPQGTRGQPIGKIVAHVRFDAIADEIAQLAADVEADLVVVGTHGRRGLSRLLLGSSAEAAVRLAPCPVLVVRPKALPEALARIEPACAQCLEARRATSGTEMWCEQHRERHGQRHTYHQGDRVSGDEEMPLVMRQ